MLHHITNDTAVLRNSIIHTGIIGIGRDAQGYERNDGWRIEVHAGLSTTGNLYLYLSHGGGDTVMDDDDSVLASWCRDLADDDKSLDLTGIDLDRHQVAEGAARLRQACDHLASVYEHNEGMQEEIDWYREAADRAEAWIAGDDNYIGKH